MPLQRTDTDHSSSRSRRTGHRPRLPGQLSILRTVTLGLALVTGAALLCAGDTLTDASDAAQCEDAAASRAALVRDFYTL